MRRITPPDEIPAEVLARSARWHAERTTFDATLHRAALLEILQAVQAVPEAQWVEPVTLQRLINRFGRVGKGPFSKANLVAGYHDLVAQGALAANPLILRRIRKKPARTQSGVAPVTVLTAPAGCPAHCIFCPDDVRMPKSYIFDEPGCQRAERDGFDPFLQTRNRIRAFENIGHAAAKVELLILGGTWSAYSRDYRAWFVQRCFDAMNAADDESLATSASLAEARARNVSAGHRNVGLVIETRPDWITPDEIVHLRTLGVTKVQLGVQSLDDAILARNGRGHDVAAVRRAMGLLRTAGFKLHLHWMPNLDGATPASDRADFARFFDDPALRPDELKIYPCSLIAGTELFARWQAGAYTPYTQDELVALLADVKPTVPPYVRINRLFRDIPAHHIEAGVRAGNLREIVARELERRGTHCGCIRCREIKRRAVDADALALRVTTYETDLTREHFIEFVTREEVNGDDEPNGGSAARHPQTAAFLRLSLPLPAPAGTQALLQPAENDSRAFLPELAGGALIRELHVYGTALDFAEHDIDGKQTGADSDDTATGDPQHAGLGTRLLEEARTMTRAAGFGRLSVIAATGTQGYYAARGFAPGPLYMTATL